MTVELAPATAAVREAAPTAPTLYGHFARIGERTEINSLYEGRFIERFAPGAFKNTIRQDRDSMKVLFQHGHDALLGDKPLGPIRELREDNQGAYYEVELYRGIPDLLMDGLRDGAYGASFRFQALREDIDHHPGKSASNPDGLPERTVLEAAISEFGPVTFPAYDGATADVRSREVQPETVRRRHVLRGDQRVTPTRLLTVQGVKLTPGRSRLHVSHPWVRARPRDFEPAWGGDAEVRAQLSRMRPRTRTSTRPRGARYRLGATRTAAQPARFRLP